MSTLETFEWGQGSPVLLCHGAASHASQWRVLVGVLESRYRLIAVNQYGYGRSPQWRGEVALTLEDQVAPLVDLLDRIDEPTHIVGHSHGATLAALLSTKRPEQVLSLSLYEPNTFTTLDQEEDRLYYEATRQAFLPFEGASAEPVDYVELGERLMDYWMGRGAWSALAPRVQEVLLSSMPSTLHEVNAVLVDPFPLADLGPLGPRSLLMFDPHTPAPALQVVKKYRETLEGGAVYTFPKLGHLAPIHYPDQVNPIIVAHIDHHESQISE
jgi:pimeloyl-ACP methyl ester carboxylesterase